MMLQTAAATPSTLDTETTVTETKTTPPVMVEHPLEITPSEQARIDESYADGKPRETLVRTAFMHSVIFMSQVSGSMTRFVTPAPFLLSKPPTTTPNWSNVTPPRPHLCPEDLQQRLAVLKHVDQKVQ